MKVSAKAALGVASGLFLAGCSSISVRSLPPLPEDRHAPVVAVSSFDNRAGFEGQWKIGDGMADLLVSELVESRNFVVVERQHLGNITGELDRQQSTLFRPEGKVQRGQLKNAQYLIRGVINDFSQTGGGGVEISFLRYLFLLGRGYTARVALTLTLVDIQTGQILSSVQSAALIRTREAYAKAKYEGISFGGDIFFQTPLGEATADAIYAGVKQIAKAMPENNWRPMVSGTRNGFVMINGGKDRGFRINTNYIVRGPAEPVTDPATGDILTYVPGPRLGTVMIVQVEDKIAFAKPIDGRDFNRGQWLVKADPNSRGP